MFILDSLLIDGLRFVLDKVALAADTELDDEAHLRERLLDAQTELEAGTMSEADYSAVERDVMQRITDARRRRQGDDGSDVEYKVTGADITLTDDQNGD